MEITFTLEDHDGLPASSLSQGNILIKDNTYFLSSNVCQSIMIFIFVSRMLFEICELFTTRQKACVVEAIDCDFSIKISKQKRGLLIIESQGKKKISVSEIDFMNELLIMSKRLVNVIYPVSEIYDDVITISDDDDDIAKEIRQLVHKLEIIYKKQIEIYNNSETR